MLHLSKAVLYVDGSSRGNPGPAGIGVAIFPADDQAKPIKEISKYIGVTTNNVAEYEAVIHALKWITIEKVERTTIKLDSQLIYNQIIGKYRVKAPHLAFLLKRTHNLKAQIKHLSFILVPRTENKSANRLAQKASKNVRYKRQKFEQKQLLQ